MQNKSLSIVKLEQGFAVNGFNCFKASNMDCNDHGPHEQSEVS